MRHELGSDPLASIETCCHAESCNTRDKKKVDGCTYGAHELVKASAYFEDRLVDRIAQLSDVIVGRLLSTPYGPLEESPVEAQ
jgi:hypothetical protein